MDAYFVSRHTEDVQKPKILEDDDVILKVTGTTVCGSDLHLLHGMSTLFTAWCMVLVTKMLKMGTGE